MTAMPPVSASSLIFTTNEASFQQDVLERSMNVPVLVDFSSAQSPVSQKITPMLETLAKEAQGTFLLAKINIQANPMLAQHFQVQSVPNVKVIFQGRIVRELKEALTLEEIRMWLQSFLGEDAIPTPKADPIAQGHAHLQAGERDEAIAAFNSHLQENPGAPESSLALARIALEQGDTQGARALLEQLSGTLTPAEQSEVSSLRFMIDAPPSEHSEEELRAAITANSLDYKARHDLAMLLAGRGELDAALEELLAIVMRDRTWEEDRARETMVKLFEVMGLQNASTRAWQKRLGRAMY